MRVRIAPKRTLAALLAALTLALAGCKLAPQAADSSSLPPAPPASQSQPQVESEAPSQPPEAALPEADGPVMLEIPAPSLAGNLLGEGDTRQIGVCLPPGYNASAEAYPVMVFLTGFTEGYEHRAEFFYAAMERLYAAGAAEGIIIAVVNGANRFGGGWYANSPVSGNWEDFVAEDVPAFLDENFRTIPSPEGRCLTGHSMGGAGALHVAMRRPGVYGSVYAMSPAIFPQGQLEVFGPGFDALELMVDQYAGLGEEAARAKFAEDLPALDGRYWWPMAYATAFGYAAEAGPPYVALPAKNADGTWAHDETWQRYESGMGGLAAKVEQYAENLKQLRGLVVDYGTADGFAFIPPGCQELAGLLEAHGVPATVEAYEGDHNTQVEQRLADIVIPYALEMTAA